MNESWIRGSLWDRIALRWTKAGPAQTDPIEILREFREASKILILPNDRVGGLFIGASFYKVIRQFYPQAQITLLVEEKKVSIARQIPFIDSVLAVALDKPVWSAAFKKIADNLRRERFDLCFCLGPDCSFRLAQLSSVCGARLRVGFHRRGLSLFNVEVVPKKSAIYEGEQYLNMLRLFGLGGESKVRWTLAQGNAQQIRARYLDEEFARGFIVAIDLAPGEGEGLSVRQLEDIVGRVIERGALAVLFFSLAEKKQVNYLKETYGRRVMPFGQDDLPGVAALVEGCAALISCNTDLLHLGLALQIPIVGIFAEDPQRWIPPHNQLVHTIQVREPRAVGIERVMEGLEMALKGKREDGEKTPHNE